MAEDHPKRCNYKKKDLCPLDGEYLTDYFISQAEKKYSLTIACIDHLTRRDLFLWSLRIYDTKETLN